MSDGTVSYPTVLPLDCFKSVSTILQNRQVMEKKEEFAHCLWNLQGYLQGVLLGVAPDHATSFGASKPVGYVAPADDDKCKQLADDLQACQAELTDTAQYSTSMATAPEPERKSWTLIVQLIPVILQLLKQLGVFSSVGDAPATGLRKTPGETAADADDDAPHKKGKGK